MKSDRQVNLRVPHEVYEVLEARARKSGLSLSTWMMLVALAAAESTDLAEELCRAREARISSTKKR
jgi:uncharacterized protein (DUF1778 family)